MINGYVKRTLPTLTRRPIEPEHMQKCQLEVTLKMITHPYITIIGYRQYESLVCNNIFPIPSAHRSYYTSNTESITIS